jgi:hypothetical protein
MAVESPFFIYTGLVLLVFGSGFFKPNMTSIVAQMYKSPELESKKDGAYTIFYMGVNSGAFFGILLCGYLGEKIGWNWGFGLAGIFMLFGLLQFWLAQNIFGDIGLTPAKVKAAAIANNTDASSEKLNVFIKSSHASRALINFLGGWFGTSIDQLKSSAKTDSELMHIIERHEKSPLLRLLEMGEGKSLKDLHLELRGLELQESEGELLNSIYEIAFVCQSIQGQAKMPPV